MTTSAEYIVLDDGYNEMPLCQHHCDKLEVITAFFNQPLLTLKKIKNGSTPECETCALEAIEDGIKIVAGPVDAT